MSTVTMNCICSESIIVAQTKSEFIFYNMHYLMFGKINPWQTNHYQNLRNIR